MSPNHLPHNKLPYRPCVGIMLLNDQGLIFTGERLDKPNAWQMPQGGIDTGETEKVAALRELEEEIGVSPEQVDILNHTENWVYYDLPDDLLGKVWGGQFRGQKQKWFLMQLKTGDDAININGQHPEFSKWKWSNHSELIAEIVPFKRDIYIRILSEFFPE